jgi:RNA polymerase sigma-70 factor (ECF subfamily)
VSDAHPVENNDQALIERCRNGDVAAFEPLVEKYRDRAWRLAFNVLRDREDASDVTQEAFVRAWQALPSFRGQSAFYTWLFRIVVNVASDRARQRAARGRAFGTERVPEEDWERTMVDESAAPDDEARRAEERERITQALAALPEHHRTIIMLSDLEGLSYREIAEVLDIPMGTVMSRLHNARKRLRAILGPMLAVLLLIDMGGLAAGSPSPPTLGAAPGFPGQPSMDSSDLHGGRDMVPSLPAERDADRRFAAEAQQMIRFSVQVILASDTATGPGEPPPEELQQLLPKLQQVFRYKQYQVLQQHRGQTAVGGVQRWPVPGDRTLEITPESVTGQTVRFQVRLQRGSVTEVTTSLQATHRVPAVIGGPRHGEGVLIVVVRTIP